MFDVRCVLGWFDRLDNFVQRDLEGRCPRRIEGHLLRGAVEVSRGTIPRLPLAAIHRQLDGVPVLAMKGFVSMQQSLHSIRAGRNVAQAAFRVAQDAGVDHARGVGRHGVDIDAEQLLRLRAILDLKARLPFLAGGNHQQQAPIERLLARRRGEPNREARRRRVCCVRGKRDDGGGGDEKCLQSAMRHA
jgi:hypothetical protein